MMTDENRYRETAPGGKLRLSDMKRNLGMEYPDDPEMTFAEGAKTLYGCAMSGGDKFSAGGLLERMALCTTTLTGRGSGEARRAWFHADLKDRWAFCCRKATE